MAQAITAVREAMLKRGRTLRTRARAVAQEGLIEDAVSLCREALAHISDWERQEHDRERDDLQRHAEYWLAARVDLHRMETEYVPHAPPLACEILSDLTRYLCDSGRADEATGEVERFTERYPHGSFRDYDVFDHRYGRVLHIVVTQREQATLKRIERATRRSSSK